MREIEKRKIETDADGVRVYSLFALLITVCVCVPVIPSPSQPNPTLLNPLRTRFRCGNGRTWRGAGCNGQWLVQQCSRACACSSSDKVRPGPMSLASTHWICIAGRFAPPSHGFPTRKGNKSVSESGVGLDKVTRARVGGSLQVRCHLPLWGTGNSSGTRTGSGAQRHVTLRWRSTGGTA